MVPMAMNLGLAVTICVATFGLALALEVSSKDGKTKSSNFVRLPGHTLSEPYRDSASESLGGCVMACMEEHACITFHWHPTSRRCQMQDNLCMTKTPATGDELGVVGVVVGDRNSLPWDCLDILAADRTSPRSAYLINAGGRFILPVWCDMLAEEGGWMVFQKRTDGSVDFYQDRAAYKAGFGDICGEYWLGLDALHAITTSKTYQLRAYAGDWKGRGATSRYPAIVVGDEASHYQLTLGAFKEGKGGDCFAENHGMKFSTHDLDLDLDDSLECAVHHHGGFWYNQCSQCHPTARYYHGGRYSSSKNDGIQWKTWARHLNQNYYSMENVRLQLRP